MVIKTAKWYRTKGRVEQADGLGTLIDQIRAKRVDGP